MIRAVRRERAGSERPSADTTPAVTEPANPLRVADRDHELADAQRRGVAELGGLELAAVGAQHGEVRERVGVPTTEKRDLAAVGERRAAAGCQPPATTCAEVSR